MAAVPEINQITEILTWIGFINAGSCTDIINNAFTTYADMKSLKEKDINELSESFSRCTVINVKIDFGLHCTKKMKYMIHLVYNFFHISSSPTKNGLIDAYFYTAFTVSSK